MTIGLAATARGGSNRTTAQVAEGGDPTGDLDPTLLERL